MPAGPAPAITQVVEICCMASHQCERRLNKHSEGWWPRSESNRYVPFGTTDFKSGASTSSATGPAKQFNYLTRTACATWASPLKDGPNQSRLVLLYPIS